MTREHVIPRWVSKAVFAPGTVNLTDAGGQVIRTAKGVDIVVRDICRECNNGWLGSLEDRIKPILEPRLKGEGAGFLPPAEHALLARWATKTALLLLHAHRHRPEALGVPPEHFDCLRRGGMPPGTQVWMGRCVPLGDYGGIFDLMNLSDEAGGAPTAYLATVSIGWAFFHVYGIDFTLPERRRPSPSSAYRATMEQIWPSPGGAWWWPPKYTLEPHQVQEVGEWLLWDPVRRGEIPAPPHWLGPLQLQAARDAAAQAD